MRKLIFLFFFLIHLSLSGQPDPNERAQVEFEEYNDLLIESPDNRLYRLLRAERQIYLEKTGRVFYETSVLDDLNFLIINNTQLEGYPSTHYYVLRGDYQSIVLQNFRAAYYDYLQVLYVPPFDERINFVNEKILEAFCKNNSIDDNRYSRLRSVRDGSTNEEINLYKSIIRSYLLYKNDFIKKNIENNDFVISGRYYFVINAIYDLANYYYAINEIEKSKNLVEKLMTLLPRNESTNYYNFESYVKIYDLASSIYTTKYHKDDDLFIDNLFLYIGAPIGQTQTLSSETLDYLDQLNSDNPKVLFIKAIYHLKKAYYNSYNENDREIKNHDFQMAKEILEEIEQDVESQGNYLYHYLKSILYFEYEGGAEAAFKEINIALNINKSDFFVFEFKAAIMRLTKHYEGKLTYFDATVDEKLKKDRTDNALEEHYHSSMVKEKMIDDNFIFDIINSQLLTH
jgi:hypothetical protein